MRKSKFTDSHIMAVLKRAEVFNDIFFTEDLRQETIRQNVERKRLITEVAVALGAETILCQY